MRAARKIVVGVDFSEQGDLALEAARVMAEDSGAVLHLVHAFPTPLILNPYATTLPSDFAVGLREAAHERLEARAARIEGVKVETHLRSGTPADAVLAAVDELGADLLVVGTHGRRGVRRVFQGSVAERVARLAPCSVLTVRSGGEPRSRRCFVVATDFSSSANAAVEAATELAAQRGVSLEVVHAFQAPPLLIPYGVRVPADVIDRAREAAQGFLEAESSRIAARGVELELRLVEGAPARAIAEHAEREGAELVIVGTHGHSGFMHMALGSVAAEIVRVAPCSVLTVKSGAE